MNYFNNQSSSHNLPLCLVAGGSGFIGYWLAKALLDQNCQVLCLDNISTDRYQNRKNLSQNPNFQNVNQEIEGFDFGQIQNLDYVFNLLPAQAQLDRVDTEAQSLISQNFYNPTLLNFAREKSAKFLLLTPDPINQNVFKSLKQIQKNEVFKVAVDFVEKQTVDFFNSQNIDARIVRSAYLYGPRMSLDSGSFISHILKNGEKNQKIELPEDGMETLYPTYIEDLVSGIIKTIFSQSTTGKIFSFINNDPITLLNLSYCIKDFWQKDLQIEFASDKNLNLKALSQKTIDSQTSISWKPKYNLEKGIKKTLDYFIDQKKLTISPINYSIEPKISQEKSVKKQPLVSLLKQEDSVKDLESQVLARKKIPEKVIKNNCPPSKDNSNIKILPSINQINPQVQKNQINITPSVVSTSLLSKIKLPKLTKNKFRKKTAISSKLNLFVLPVFIFLTLVFLPRIIFTNSVKKAIDISNQIEENLSSGEQVQKKLKKSQQKISLAKALKPIVYWQDNIISSSKNGTYFEFLEFLPKLNNVYQNIDKNQQNYQELKDIIFGSQLKDPTVYQQNLLTALNQISNQLSLLQLDLLTKQEDQLSVKISSLKKEVQNQIELLSILPDLFSFSGKKNYLVLVQDNHELRSTGGFISVAGLLTVENGKIINFDIKDVFELDSEFKGQVVPPQEFEKYQVENSWYFHDLNFAPSFSCNNIDYENGQHCTAGDAVWFAQKTFNQVIDGVFALTPVFYQNILSYTDPIFLADYSQEITAQNVLEQIKLNTQAGENKFLLALTKEVFNKIKNIDGSQSKSILFAAHKALSEKDLLLYLPNTQASSQIKNLNWGGGLRQSPQNLLKFGQIDISDFLAIYENNFSFHKNNYYAQNSLNHTIDMADDGTIISTSSFIIKNTSNTNAWPGGDYDKSYLSFLIPQDTVLKQISISGKKLNSEDIFKKNEGDYRSIGFIVSTKINSESVVKITYQHKTKLPIKKDSFNYSLYFQKQPGSFDAPLNLTINYPSELSVSKISQQADLGSGQISYFDTLDRDKLFAVSFSR